MNQIIGIMKGAGKHVWGKSIDELIQKLNEETLQTMLIDGDFLRVREKLLVYPLE